MLNDPALNSVTILGSLPPLRALSNYCLEFSYAVSRFIETEFISFKHIYPPFLYPGGKLKEDNTFSGYEQLLNIKERRYLTWYNPISWIIEGVSTKGQLLHAQWWSPPLILVYMTISFLYKIRKKPVVITVHNIIPHEKKLFFDLCSRIFFKIGDHFIVHSRTNMELLAESFNIDRDRITSIPHGPLHFRNMGRIDREEARKELCLSKQEQAILLFGAVRPYKGVDVALKAFAEVLKEIPEARLIIAGSLWEEWEMYEEIINSRNISTYVLKHLHYIESSEVAKFFIASDLVILPYRRFESQSGVGATAVAFRKPMIVSRTGGLPDLVVDKANIIPPGDIKALAGRIIHCLKNSSEIIKMSKEAGVIAEKISWNSVAMKTLSVYEKLMHEKMSI